MSTYFMSQVFRVSNAQLYGRYRDAVVPIVAKHGGEYVFRSDQITLVRGPEKPERMVLIRFPDQQALRACFTSPEYLAIASLRESSTDSRAFVIEGD